MRLAAPTMTPETAVIAALALPAASRLAQRALSLGHTRRRREYNAYINSPAWHARRNAALRRAGHRCERCGTTQARLHVHHLHYRTFTRERPQDLRVLCVRCHRRAHRRRLWYRPPSFTRRPSHARRQRARR